MTSWFTLARAIQGEKHVFFLIGPDRSRSLCTERTVADRISIPPAWSVDPLNRKFQSIMHVLSAADRSQHDLVVVSSRRG